MAASVIAVLGTLLGALVAHLTATRTTRVTLEERRRQALADAVPLLLDALADHRSEQYMKIAARREGLPDTVEARRLRYAARKSVTKARGRVRMATRDHELLAAVHTAVGTTFALGEAADDAAVQEAGDRARAAHDALEEVAAHRVFAAR